MNRIHTFRRFILERKHLLALALLIIFVLYSAPNEKFISFQVGEFFPRTNKIACYRKKTEETTLPDISELNPPPRKNSIFFHETSCKSRSAGKIVITARQACAVESAARLNPHNQTFILYASTGGLKLEENTESDRFLQALLLYENIKILHVDFEKYSNNTPLENLYKKGILEASHFAVQHASDLLRFLTLWKYGGTYLDLDVLVVKPLEDLGVNYAGIESYQAIGGGILNFDSDNFGHDLATDCMYDLKNNFEGHEWGNNGPGVITRMAQRVCIINTVWIPIWREIQCAGGSFVIYPRKNFYPIDWKEWWMYFSENYREKVMNLTRESYLIHVWNKKSGRIKLLKGGRDAYSVYAQEFCPRVYAEVDVFF